VALPSPTVAVQLLTTILSQASLQPTANTPRAPSKRSLVKFNNDQGPANTRLLCSSLGSSASGLSLRKASDAEQLGLSSEYCLGRTRRVDGGNGGQQKPMREEVRVYQNGTATHGGRNLRNNYTLRLRSENWGALYSAIGSRVSRCRYSQRFTLILLSCSAFRWLVLRPFTAMKLHFRKHHRSSTAAREDHQLFTGRPLRCINGRTGHRQLSEIG